MSCLIASPLLLPDTEVKNVPDARQRKSQSCTNQYLRPLKIKELLMGTNQSRVITSCSPTELESILVPGAVKCNYLFIRHILTNTKQLLWPPAAAAARISSSPTQYSFTHFPNLNNRLPPAHWSISIHCNCLLSDWSLRSLLRLHPQHQTCLDKRNLT